MRRRTIPSSNETIPVIGLGTWKTFDVTMVDDKIQLEKNLELFAENGGRLIDTSPMYGKAEEVIGQVTPPRFADRFFYATKVWTSGREEGIRQITSSMQKMKRTMLDLVQIHNLLDWKTHLPTLNKLKESGKIRYTGITHYTTAHHDELADILLKEEIDFVQVNYSIGVRNAEKRLLPVAVDRGVAVLINEPLEKGALMQQVKGKSLPAWAIEQGIGSWAQYFLKYIIAHPAVTCVIPATSRPENLLDNLGAGIGDLPDEKLRKRMIAELFD